MHSKNPRHASGIDYSSDMEQLGQSLNAFREDNILSSVFRRNPMNKLTLVKEIKGYYEHEWFTGFSNTISFSHRDIYPLRNTKFIFLENLSQNNSVIKKYLTSSEISLNTRFAYKEKYYMGEFERISLGTKYPIISVMYKYGMKGVLNSDYEYHQLILNINHWFNVREMGWSKYIFEAGNIWGKLPYPLLKLHEGNETYQFDEYAFNMMNYYEFVSDKYISLYYTHHFEGWLFFNRIPLLRKLKWREVGFIKGVAGKLSKYNQDYVSFPTGLHGLSKPYFEGGVGVENILKIIRFDMIWRLSYLNNPDISKFGLRLTLAIDF